MKGSYSPYNRTFKFICLQNQLAHIKNKSSVKSLGKSNISLHNSPSKIMAVNHSKKDSYTSTRPNINSFCQGEESGIGLRKTSYSFIQPYRVIHINKSYEKRKKREQFHENQRLAKRLCNVSCDVTTKEETQKQFEQHLNFKSIARRYEEGGELKELLRISDYNSMTASKAEKSINLGHQLCNVASLRCSHLKKSRKKQSNVFPNKPKSSIIRIY